MSHKVKCNDPFGLSMWLLKVVNSDIWVWYMNDFVFDLSRSCSMSRRCLGYSAVNENLVIDRYDNSIWKNQLRPKVVDARHGVQHLINRTSLPGVIICKPFWAHFSNEQCYMRNTYCYMAHSLHNMWVTSSCCWTVYIGIDSCLDRLALILRICAFSKNQQFAGDR